MIEDPVGILGGDLNFYRYTNNSPVLRVDPFGLRSPIERALNTEIEGLQMLINNLNERVKKLKQNAPCKERDDEMSKLQKEIEKLNLNRNKLYSELTNRETYIATKCFRNSAMGGRQNSFNAPSTQCETAFDATFNRNFDFED